MNNSIKNIGNCNDIIDWDSVIADCASNEPAYIGPSHGRGDDIPGLDDILDIWENAGYVLEKNGGTVAWDMFLPGQQFDSSIVDKWNEFYGLNCSNVWISRIWPGRFAPIHWDVHDNEVNLPKCARYHTHIGKPEWGHIFIVGDYCLYNYPQGTTFEWDNRKMWHAGTNCGTTPKYIWNAW